MVNKALQIYHNDSQLMNDAIDRIIVEIYGIKRNEGAKTFLFTGIGSSVGTTSVSLNIAIALASAGWKTLFVDCDMRKNTRYKRLNSEDAETLSLTEYLNIPHGVYAIEDIICNTNYPLLDLITAGDGKDSPVRILCTDKMEKMVLTVRERYDFVIFDTPSINIVKDAEILIPVVDRHILVAAINVSSKRQLADARENLRMYHDRYAGLIVNRMDLHQYRDNIRDYDYFAQSRLDKKHGDDMRKIEERERKRKKSEKHRKKGRGAKEKTADNTYEEMK